VLNNETTPVLSRTNSALVSEAHQILTNNRDIHSFAEGRLPDPNALEFGQVVCDMHYGIDLSRIPGAKILCQQTIRTDTGSQFIESTVSRQIRDAYSYTNKYLVIIDEDSQGNLICAASYDARTLTIYTISYGESNDNQD